MLELPYPPIASDDYFGEHYFGFLIYSLLNTLVVYFLLKTLIFFFCCSGNTSTEALGLLIR